jgi:hypothetical protein
MQINAPSIWTFCGSYTAYNISSYALGCQVQGESMNGGGMRRNPQEKKSMTRSSFNVRI